MKRLLPLILLVAALTAQTPEPSAADRDYAAFRAVLTERPHPDSRPKDVAQLSAAQKRTLNETGIRWQADHFQRIVQTGQAFDTAHPGDARRWDVVIELLKRRPLFVAGFGDDQSKPIDVIIDEAASAAWQERADALRRELLASADAPEGARESVEWGYFSRDFRATSAAREKGESFDYSAFRSRFESHVARYKALDAVAERATDYLGALEYYGMTDQAQEIWRDQLNAPNAALREKAAERLKYFETMSQPLDITFTAVDGRKVDLKDLRGKVVLVDFWATWCGPCIAELPNIKQVYAEYHDKGFEIVGISLDREQDRQKLLDFCAQEQMPWPQHFDGKYWKNEIAVKYAIKAIPAMFLLDQEGRVVSTNARGEKLESEVKRLLKL